MAADDIKRHAPPDGTADPLLLGCLDTAVALTGQRDTERLAAALIIALRQQVQAKSFRLLTISNTARDTEFSEANIQNAFVCDRLDPAVAPVPVGADEDLLACVLSQKSVSRTRQNSRERRLVLPIFGASGVTALFVIEGLQEAGGEDEILARLLRIFSNQMLLLSRNEMDGLTNLYNRQSFDGRIKQLVLNAGRQERRMHHPASAQQSYLALLDIDHFKEVNDRYGHLYGDEVLVQLAQLMSRSFRKDDLMFRYGGEEFAVILTGTTPNICVHVLENFRQKVEAYPFPQVGCKTISVGVTSIVPGEIVDTIINRADKALYYAKENGRNRVCCYEQLVAEGKLTPVTVDTGDIELF